MPTGFELNGLDLRTLAHEITSPNGWDTFPGMKASGVQYAFTHGEDNSGRRFYKARDIDLNMVILATDETGVVTSSPEEHVDENIETLMRALHDTFEPLPLIRTLASGATRTAYVRPIDFMRYEDHIGLSRAVTVTLRMGYPFWHGDSDAESGVGPLVATNLGSAPVNDMVLIFATAGRITHDETGDYVESADAGVSVNVGTGEILAGDPASISANTPWWMQFEPGVNNLTLTGGDKSVSWFHGYF